MTTNISPALEGRLQTVTENTGLELGDLINIGLTKVANEHDATGRVEVNDSPPRRAVLPPQLEARLREIDQTLGLLPGHGVAESTLTQVIEDIKRGEFSLVIGGWNFERGDAWAKEILASLGMKWSEYSTR